MGIDHPAQHSTASDTTRDYSLPAFATVPAWVRISGVGRSRTYELLGSGHLRAKKLANRTLIDVAHGLAWLDSLPDAAVRPHGAKHKRTTPGEPLGSTPGEPPDDGAALPTVPKQAA